MRKSISIEKAAELIKKGELVAFPTETVYGLGADALNPLAVAKIFEIKERPFFDPLIVHISEVSQLKRLILKEDERVDELAEKFWPGPLTIVLPKSSLIPDIVTSGLPTVGIRMPADETARELISRAGRPIAAPSANKFGRISPTRAAHVKKQLPDLEYILDGGKSSVGIESTIIELTEKGFRILREGIITKEKLMSILPLDKPVDSEIVAAPGMLESHYSPTKKLLIDDGGGVKIDKNRAGLISFTGKLEEGYKKIIRVSRREELKDYAVNIFEALHSFEDYTEVELIVAEGVSEEGIGRAIMDRLRKAEYKWRYDGSD